MSYLKQSIEDRIKIAIVLPQALLDQHLKTVVFWPEMEICSSGCSEVLIFDFMVW